MLGFAIGVLGMALGDFCDLEPSEFDAVCAAYKEKVERVEREAWERARIMTCIGIQPHVGKKIRPRDIMHLPWDDARAPAEIVNKDEHLARLKRRLARSES